MKKNFVSSGSGDGWLIQSNDFRDLVAVFLNTIYPDRYDLVVLIPGVGLDDSCMDIAQHHRVKSVTILDVDDQSIQHFLDKSASNGMSAPADETTEFDVTNNVRFVTDWDTLVHQRFRADVILDKSLFDVFNASYTSWIPRYISYIDKLLTLRGTFLVVSMTVQNVQSKLLRKLPTTYSKYFGILFGNNEYKFPRNVTQQQQRTLRSTIKRVGVVSIGIATKDIFHECTVDSLTNRISRCFSDRKVLPIKAFGDMGLATLLHRNLYTQNNLMTRENAF